MSKKTLALILCAGGLICFALPFVNASIITISGFSAAFGYSFMGYSIIGANFLLIAALLLAVAAIALAFTKADFLCPVFNIASAVLVIAFRFASVSPIAQALGSFFDSGVVSGGAGIYLAFVLFAAAACVRFSRSKKPQNS